MSVPTRMQTMGDVLAELDRIIDHCREQSNPHGLFTCLYRRVTQSVQEHLDTGYFDDDERMVRLDVVFARRYVRAYWNYQEGKQCSGAWCLAFQMGEQRKGMMLKHLLLGVNAHINLDLGLAAAEVAPGKKIESLRRDFFRINVILKNMIDTMQSELNRYSPLMKWVDRLGGKTDEWLAGFSVVRSRQHAWEIAVEAAVGWEATWEADLDRKIQSWSAQIQRLSPIEPLVARFEKKDYSIIYEDMVQAGPPPLNRS